MDKANDKKEKVVLPTYEELYERLTKIGEEETDVKPVDEVKKIIDEFRKIKANAEQATNIFNTALQKADKDWSKIIFAYYLKTNSCKTVIDSTFSNLIYGFCENKLLSEGIDQEYLNSLFASYRDSDDKKEFLKSCISKINDSFKSQIEDEEIFPNEIAILCYIWISKKLNLYNSYSKYDILPYVYKAFIEYYGDFSEKTINKLLDDSIVSILNSGKKNDYTKLAFLYYSNNLTLASECTRLKDGYSSAITQMEEKNKLIDELNESVSKCNERINELREENASLTDKVKKAEDQLSFETTKYQNQLDTIKSSTLSSFKKRIGLELENLKDLTEDLTGSKKDNIMSVLDNIEKISSGK